MIDFATATPLAGVSAPIIAAPPQPRMRPNVPLLTTDPPKEIVLDWTNIDLGTESLPPELLPNDLFDRAVDCSDTRVASAPPNTHRCNYDTTSSLTLSKRKLWLAATTSGHEFDGMYGRNVDVVVLAPFETGPFPLYTFRVVDLDVADCNSTLSLRRLRVQDLDGDGMDELCVESVEEHGVGLFYVMNLEKAGRRWKPIKRTRSRIALGFDPVGLSFKRRPELDAQCPTKGYALPAGIRFEARDAFVDRLAKEGDLPLDKCPPPDPLSCLGIDDVCPRPPY